VNGGEWFEDPEFWEIYAPLMFDEARWAETPEIVSRIEALAGAGGGGRILDLCCGVGRHSLEFARRGWKVTGVDITPSYLEAARETALASGLELDLVLADVRKYKPEGLFDLCINLYTSFGYFSSRDEDMDFIAKARSCLVPGGVFVLETLGKEVAARDFIAFEEFERSGWKVRTEYSIKGAWEAQTNRWILEKPGQRVDRSFDLRLYSGFEIRQAFLQAGFASCRILGGFDGRPYDEKAESLVALGKA